MSELSRSLRRELTSEFPNGNPLVIIGTSPQILDLGLTADELFEYITKDVARRLILRFHTDRQDFSERPEVAVSRGHLAEAYRQLQDRETFDRALTQFRDLKAEERSEIRTLRIALENTKQKLFSYTSKEVEISEGAKRLDRDRRTLSQARVMQERIIPGLEGDITRLEKKVNNLESSLSHYRRMHRGLTRYVSFLADERTAVERGIHILEAKWVVVVTLVPFEFRQEAPSAFDSRKRWKAGFLEDVGLLIPKKELALIRKHWFSSIDKFREPVATEFKTHAYRPRLHVFGLSSGKLQLIFGWKRACHGWAMGSIPVLEGRAPFTRSALLYRQFGENVVENLVPFLLPGGLLVTQTIRKMGRGDQDLKNEMPITARETKHIILGAG
jgi:hypothetical protein